MISLRKIAAVLGVIALVAGVLRWWTSDPGAEPAASQPVTAGVQPAESGVSVARSGPTSDDLRAWLETGVSRWSEDDLVQAFLGLDETTRRSLYEKLMTTCRADPDKLLPFMEKLAEAWGRKDPGPAMIFFAGVHDVRGIIPLERRIINGWVERDFAGVGAYFQRLSHEHAINPVAQLAFLTAVTQNEHKEKFGELLAWVDGLKAPEDRLVQTSAIEALTRLGQPENFRRIADVLANNLDNGAAAAALASLIAQRAAGHPEEAIREVEKIGLKAGEHGPMIVDALFLSLGSTHPDLAVKLINEGILDKHLSCIATGAATPDGKSRRITAEELRDIALDRFLYTFGTEDPEYTLAVAQHFHDPELKATYEKSARDWIAHRDALASTTDSDAAPASNVANPPPNPLENR